MTMIRRSLPTPRIDNIYEHCIFGKIIIDSPKHECSLTNSVGLNFVCDVNDIRDELIDNITPFIDATY